MDIHILPILKDNYAFVIRSNGLTGVIDPGEAQPFIDFLDDKGWSLDWIINTHHHSDHTNGNANLITRYGAKVAAPKECGKADVTLKDGDQFQFGETVFAIIETPGHTMGHVCLYSARDKALFSGDTVFASGCGRLFEGTPSNMYTSFEKFSRLPDDTTIYFGHEYTKTNCKFASDLLSDNYAVQKRLEEVEGKSSTIPTTLAQEKMVNPFFLAKDEDEFARYRKVRDGY